MRQYSGTTGKTKPAGTTGRAHPTGTQRRRFRIAVLCLAAAAAGCVGTSRRPPPAPPWEAPLARTAPVVGTIHDGRDGSALSPAALVDRLAAADFVLLGERHDNPDHHRLQAWIVEQMLARGRPFAVAFEMIDGDQAPKLAAYLATSSYDAAGLGPALDWDQSGWPPWPLYRPIAAAALARDAPLLAANLPSGLARTMARQGLAAMPPALSARLNLDGLNDRPVDRAVLAGHEAEIEAAHCGLLPKSVLAPFALTQYARDAQMARVMADDWNERRRAAAGRPGVILIAGAGHVRNDRGVPFHLARLAPTARTIALAFIEAGEGQTNADDEAASLLPFDAIWYTARVDEGDGCDKMKTIK